MERDVVIVAAVRTAVGKAKRGALSTVRPETMAAAVLTELISRAAPLKPEEIDDVILGCAMPEAEQGLNLARVAALRAGFPVSVPARTVNRFCSSGLQTIADAACAIRAGMAEVVIAGGVESMSMVPMIGNKFAPDPIFAAGRPEVYMSMGLTAERVAAEYHVDREDQDGFALESHRRAIAAQEHDAFREEILPLEVEVWEAEGSAIRPRRVRFGADEGPRRDTTPEALARLEPVFRRGGTVTAGNSSQMSDGAAAVLLMEAGRAADLGLTPRARFVSYAVAGVAPELMGVGPVEAVPKALARAGLRLSDIDMIELNEAFAAQALAVMRVLEMDPAAVNVHGGAIALGHPLGCTGAKLTTQLVHALPRRKARYGMVTMCVGGGMGAAGIFENLN